ncbi:MAG TPA: sulfite exporter TauE/SafE family protein [Thermoanaerobaculia bacterium]|nr:sulfite exporter TauE/SafE family protein [Thermoanaerobaculia bacterium]
MPEWLGYVALFASGAVAGALNVVAGGGSFLTLPVLIFLGLPATVANATNRVGILAQNVGAVWGFHRHRVLAWRWALAAAGPAVVGSVLGTWAALEVSDEAFRKILAFLMVAITLWSLLSRSGSGVVIGALPPRPGGRRLAVLAGGFFAVGIYGGFVQAGVGFLILAVTTFAGLDLVRGNAIKVTIALLFTAISLAIFAWQDMVEWLPGAALGAGNLAGGLVGVRLTVLKGHAWIKGVVTVTVILFAVLLWFG